MVISEDHVEQDVMQESAATMKESLQKQQRFIQMTVSTHIAAMHIADRSRHPKVRTTTSTRTECALNQRLKRPLTASKRLGGSGCLVCAVAVRVHPCTAGRGCRSYQPDLGRLEVVGRERKFGVSSHGNA
jgi:hypothetical protein